MRRVSAGDFDGRGGRAGAFGMNPIVSPQARSSAVGAV